MATPSAADASNILPKNTHRQPSAPTRRPPNAGPATPPVPTMLRCKPSALPRSAPGNAEIIMAIPVPCVIAAPTPWMILDRIIQGACRGARKGPTYQEDDKAGDVYRLATDDVREPAHGQKEGAGGQGKCYHHPLRGGQIGLKVLGNGGEGDQDAPVIGHRRERAHSYG